jgi:hypothetical protein
MVVSLDVKLSQKLKVINTPAFPKIKILVI